jgi:4-amino-4-deoxy-L-arabinose transferase-like glycosyltransferase
MANVGQGLRQKRSFGWWPWLVLAAFWFITMPFRPLVDPDEGRYAEIPREMAATGDWVTPRLNGLKYFEKPPMQYWATAATYSVFGFSEWTARLWTVGLGFLCLPMVFGWTRRLYGESAGFAAMVGLVVSPYFELIAHLNILDSGFAFFLAAAVFAFALGQSSAQGSSEERRWMLLAWLAAALAVLTKGIVVGVLAGATLVTYCGLERDMRPWRRLHLALGLPLFLAVTVPWFVAVSARNPSFLQFFFVHEHFARFLTKVHKREEPWWYFLSMLAIGALPWLLKMPRALRAAWLEPKGDSGFKPLKFMLVFSSITLLFFSVSSSKLAPYILPMMPALAAVIGASVAPSPTFARTMARITGVLMPVMAAGLFIYTMRRYGYFPQSAIQYLVGALTVGVYGVWATWKREVPAAAAVWATAASAILGWQCLLSAFTELPERSSYKLVKTIKPLIGPQTELFTIGQYRETLSPYLGRTMTVVQFQGELEFGLTEEPSLGLTTDAFLARWNASTNAVAFIAPGILEEWRSHGLQAKVIGGDNQTLVVSRL